MPTRNTIFHSPQVLHDFDEANPVDFNLYDDEGRQQIYILNDQSPGRQHHLILINNSEQDYEFEKPRGFIPSRANYHFELRFRPGTLDPEYLTWLSVGTGGWRLGFEEHFDSGDDIHDGTVSLYLLFVGQEDKTLEAGRTQVVILNHIKAGIPGGSRGSRMELHFQTDGNKLLTSPAPNLIFKRQERLQIVNNRGVKELPMKVGFEGSSTVLNDESTLNDLTLQLSNFLHNSEINLNGRDSESPTKFILSFDTSETDAAWALCDDDNAKAIEVFLHFDDLPGISFHIRPEFQGENPQWIITFIDDIPLEVGAFFHLHLDGLISAMPSGFTNLYLLYENIPGYWDGCFKIPIEKSPLKFDDQKTTDPNDPEAHEEDGDFNQKTKVGIGNTEPVDTLDVKGGIHAETMVLRRTQATKKVIDADGKEVEEEIIPLKVNGAIEADRLTLENGINSKNLLAKEKITLGDVEMAKSFSKIGEEEFETVKINSTLADSQGFLIPPGGIIMWSGTNIPDGWLLCNGKNGTPNLQGRFIVGYDTNDSDYAKPGNRSEEGNDEGIQGGKKDVTLSIEQMPAHRHHADGAKLNTESGGRHRHQVVRKKSATEEKALSGSNTIAHHTDIHTNEEYRLQGVSGNASVGRTSEHTGHGHSFTIPSQGEGLAHENRPPYYVLAFIMKKHLETK